MSILDAIATKVIASLTPECEECGEKVHTGEVVKETEGLVYRARCPNCDVELWVESLPEAREHRNQDSIFE